MPSGNRSLIASTVFTPVAVAPVLVFANRNATGAIGGASDAPVRIAAGQYRVFIQGAIADQMVSYTKRATTAAGGLLHVSVLLTPIPNTTTTQIDIFIRDNAGVASDAASFVEVTIDRLPL